LTDEEKREYDMIEQRLIQNLTYLQKNPTHSLSDDEKRESSNMYNRLQELLEISEEENREEEAIYNFKDIHEHIVRLQSDLSCSMRTVILMIVIELESEINKFCYFNLGEAVSDAIERLSVPEKLEVIHRILGLS